MDTSAGPQAGVDTGAAGTERRAPSSESGMFLSSSEDEDLKDMGQLMKLHNKK